MKERTEPASPFGTMSQEPWHHGKGTKASRDIQLKCGKVCTYASCKTTRTWESFYNQGTKITLLSGKLWLIDFGDPSICFDRGGEGWFKKIHEVGKHSPPRLNPIGMCKNFSTPVQLLQWLATLFKSVILYINIYLTCIILRFKGKFLY